MIQPMRLPRRIGAPGAASRPGAGAAPSLGELERDVAGILDAALGILRQAASHERSREAGVIGWSEEIGGGSLLRMAEINVAWLVPANARLPVAISWSTQPSAKMSVRASAGLPSSCSGAMYGGVPRIAPSVVTETPWEAPSSRPSCPSTQRALPGRSRAASRRTSSASRSPVSGRDERSPCDAVVQRVRDVDSVAQHVHDRQRTLRIRAASVSPSISSIRGYDEKRTRRSRDFFE